METYSEYIERTETEPQYEAIEALGNYCLRGGFLDWKVRPFPNAFEFGPMEFVQHHDQYPVLSVYIKVAGKSAHVFKDVDIDLAEQMILKAVWARKK